MQTLNSGIISGQMFCSLQNERNFLRILANRGENEASRRDARVAHEGKSARKLNSHRARLAFLTRLSLSLISSPKNTQKIMPVVQARSFVSLSSDSPGESARSQRVTKYLIMNKLL